MCVGECTRVCVRVAHPDLYVSAVVAARGQLDAAEGDWTLEGDPDGRLLHAVLSVQPWGPGDSAAAEVPLD